MENFGRMNFTRVEGTWKSWRDNGSVFVKQFFRNGWREGEIKSWDVDGQIRKQEFYKNGNRIDPCFTRNKKFGFCRIKRYFQKGSLSLLDTVLISDLFRIV